MTNNGSAATNGQRPATIRETLFTAIDFESAGTSPGQNDAPVQIGLASWSYEKGLHQTYVSYLHCEQKITWSAQKIHGIRKEDLSEAPNLLSLWPLLRERLGNGPVVAHGHGTEKRFLRSFPGHRFSPWIDTLQLARAAWPQLPSHSLSDLCHSLGLRDFSEQAQSRTWHDALYDALASLAVLSHLVHTYQLADQPLHHLKNPDTTTWHRLRHL